MVLAASLLLLLLLLLLLQSTCDCLRHLSSLADINTSASTGSTILLRIDDNTLLLLLLLLPDGSSHRLLVSPTKQSATFGSVDKYATG